MKKFNENDIEKMLRNTEKTEPSFDKRVSFAKPVIIKRRRYFSVISAACLLVVLVSIFTFIMVSQIDNVPDISTGNSEYSEFVSGVSYPEHESLVFSNDVSFEFSVPDDESREIHGGLSSETFSGNEESSIIVPPEKIFYPDNEKFYNGQGISNGQSLIDYFSSNPLKHLSANNELHIFSRPLAEKKFIIDLTDRLASELHVDFKYVQDMTANGGCIEFIDDKREFNFQVGSYGDWILTINKSDFLNVVYEGENTEALLFETKKLVSRLSSLFSEKEYIVTEEQHSSGVSVYLYCENSNDVLNEYADYVFSFSKRGELYILTSIEHVANNMVSIGKFDNRLYNSALLSLYENTFYSENGFELTDEMEFTVVGYDVRYLTHFDEAIMCPYYAFVILINPESDNAEYKTVFVPAVVDDNVIYLQ